MNEEDDIDTDLYQEKDDANLVRDDECPCGYICSRCLGISDRDFF